jgi:RNA binding exosome subunit
VSIHYATVTAYAREEELDAVKNSVLKILPEGTSISENVFEPEEEGEVFTHKLYALEAKIDKKKAEDLFKKIMNSLDEYDTKNIAGKPGLHIDDECMFYVRLSKREATEGRIVLDTRDSIQIRFKVAAYPAVRENALKVVLELMKDAGVR